MKRYMTFLIIEYKRIFRCLFMMLASLAGSAALILAGIAGAGLLLYHSSMLSPVRIGMVFPENSRVMGQAVGLAETMSSISSVCTFEELHDAEEAVDALSRGELQAVMVFPEHFAGDLVNGANTPAELITGKSPLPETILFREILQDGVVLIDSGESAIYAINDAWSAFRSDRSFDEMNLEVTETFIMEVLQRGKVYQNHRLSRFSFTGILQLGLWLLLPLLISLNFGFLYGKNDLSIERKLVPCGLSRRGIGLMKIFAVSSVLWLVSMLFIFLQEIVLGHIRFTQGLVHPTLPLCLALWLPILSMSAFVHLVYSWDSGNGTGYVLLLVLTMLMILTSGTFLPVSFLPAPIRKISYLLPLTWWRRFLMDIVLQRNFALSAGICAVIFLAGWLFSGGGERA